MLLTLGKRQVGCCFSDSRVAKSQQGTAETRGQIPGQEAKDHRVAGMSPRPRGALKVL